MKTATERDLRNNFAITEASLRSGAELCIKKRGEPAALLTAFERDSIPSQISNPDFKARRKAIWGERVFSEREVNEMRRYEIEGKEG